MKNDSLCELARYVGVARTVTFGWTSLIFL